MLAVSPPGVTFIRATGNALDRHLADLARLRIEVFREFPYLYDGSLDYERHYLRTYAGVEGSVIVLALYDGRVVGASTGLPMAAETDTVKAPLVHRGYDPARVFYFGESVLDKAYRGRGVGVRFFAEREAHVRALGGFDWTCFCAVERPADHPRKPPGYEPLDAFWRRRGYAKHPELRARFSWKEPDEDAESEKPMVFWLKPCETQA